MRDLPPIFRTAAGFAIGAALSAAIGFDRTLGFILISLCLILIWRGPKSRTIPLIVIALAGLAWATAARHSQAHCLPSPPDGAPASVVGYFIRVSEEGASTLRLNPGEGGCSADLRVYSRDEAPPEAEPVRVEGRWIRSLRPDGAELLYLSANSVTRVESAVPVPWSVRMRARIRGRAADALRRRLGSQAGVAAALVLADRDGIPRDLVDAFARSGTAHLLSISGFHVGVIAALLGALLSATGQPPRRRALWIAAGVWFYVLLIGAPTSATRAAWMTTAFVLGRLRLAPARPLGALGLAMLMIALLRPQQIAGAGFQLTVAGTAGILILTRWILRHWPLHRGRRLIATPVAAGVGASVFTAPILAWHFGQIPLLSLPASILLTPLVAAAVPGVLVAIVLDLLHIPGAAVVGLGAEGLLDAVTRAAAWLGNLPGTVVLLTPREAILLTAGALAPMALGHVQWRSRASVRVAVSVLSALATLWAGQAALSLAGRGALHIVAIDVGQGDAIAIRTPRGRWLLVDAGPRGFGGSDAGLTRVVPYLHGQGARRLEALILSHPDEDHAGGMAAVLRHVRTESVLGPGLAEGQAGQMDGLAEAQSAGIPWRRAFAGDRWTIDGVVFRVLSPPRPGSEGDEAEALDPGEPNDWSVVLLIEFGAFSALLMGDASDDVERRILDRIPEVTLLKVGHHGSATSTSALFLDAASPSYAIIPVGARNRYGHPSPIVTRRLIGAGAEIYRTDLHGTITLVAERDGRVRVRAR